MIDLSPEAQWFPIAGSSDLPFRHVFHAELLGQELAAWRADDGFVNVWENRCLHRGVRLSLGHNLGHSLKCQYHGWTYSSRTSNCTYIPAHPENAPARLICNKVYPAAERYGLVWSTIKGEGKPPVVDHLEGRGGLALRGIAVSADATSVLSALLADGMVEVSGFAMRTPDGGASLFVQPVSHSRSIIRGLAHDTTEADRLTVLHGWNERLRRVRDSAEAAAGGLS